jgi:phosphoglucomutase
MQIDLSRIAKHSFGSFEVEIIDGLNDYVELMKKIFDFASLKNFLSRRDFKILIDSMHGGNLIAHTHTHMHIHTLSLTIQ